MKPSYSSDHSLIALQKKKVSILYSRVHRRKCPFEVWRPFQCSILRERGHGIVLHISWDVPPLNMENVSSALFYMTLANNVFHTHNLLFCEFFYFKSSKRIVLQIFRFNISFHDLFMLSSLQERSWNKVLLHTSGEHTEWDVPSYGDLFIVNPLWVCGIKFSILQKREQKYVLHWNVENFSAFCYLTD